ncbi:hypothetical protein [Chitinolyticbacter meiyuanensis]|uniref:hypothetical protein n=1 Tax=Chitinolyticbacter meiyuanensis TaxID=682798 RepID=UPI0011E5929B|nr:hypothetical protein [Chitinolyticbacter meiyuanensis]
MPSALHVHHKRRSDRVDALVLEGLRAADEPLTFCGIAEYVGCSVTGAKHAVLRLVAVGKMRDCTADHPPHVFGAKLWELVR